MPFSEMHENTIKLFTFFGGLTYDIYTVYFTHVELIKYTPDAFFVNIGENSWNAHDGYIGG
jgi:hypothetical protein